MICLVKLWSTSNDSDNTRASAIPPSNIYRSTSPFPDFLPLYLVLEQADAYTPRDRKSGPPKAWQSGMNPITQRSTIPPPQNGNVSQPKAGSQKPHASMELGSADKHAHDRLVFLMANFMVCKHLIRLTSSIRSFMIMAGSSRLRHRQERRCFLRHILWLIIREQ